MEKMLKEDRVAGSTGVQEPGTGVVVLFGYPHTREVHGIMGTSRPGRLTGKAMKV